MEDGKEERLGLTLGRTMVFHGEGAVFSPSSANGGMPTEENGMWSLLASETASSVPLKARKCILSAGN